MLSSLRVEQAARDAESRRNAAFSSVRNSPGALVFGDARTSDDHSPRRTGPLYRRVRRFVKRSRHRVSAAARSSARRNRLTGYCEFMNLAIFPTKPR